MKDSGMGSLLLFTKKTRNKNRVFGECIAEYLFHDEDGVEVNVALNIDEDGDLFELDIWKVDFSPLIHLPFMG